MAVKLVGPQDGGTVLISSTTVSAATAISFTNIPTQYKDLIVRWYDVLQNGLNTHLYVRVNDDSSTVYAQRFWRFGNNVVGYSTAGSPKSGFGLDHDGFGIVASSNTATSSSAEMAHGHLRIARYAETGEREMESQSTMYRLTSTPTFFGYVFGNGVYKPTNGSAITKVEFLRSSTQTINGKFYLYGVY